MLIRSQNKKAIVNMDMIDTIEARDKQIRYFSGGGMETLGLLGEYSTEEKALKVLDMIQEAYCKCESGKVLMCGSWEITKTVKAEESLKDYAHEHRGTFIFQMPQDSEV